jgi:hypothetical protein
LAVFLRLIQSDLRREFDVSAAEGFCIELHHQVSKWRVALAGEVQLYRAGPASGIHLHQLGFPTGGGHKPTQGWNLAESALLELEVREAILGLCEGGVARQQNPSAHGGHECQAK